jgi:hypothetical protein
LKEALRPLGQQLDAALAGPKYGGLTPLEKRAVLILAVNAVMIIESGQCSDPSAQGSAAESFLFTFAGIGRKPLKPVFDLPPARKSDLLDEAMDLASQQPEDTKRINALCNGKLLPASAAKPIAERRAGARQVLSIGLSPPARQEPAAPQPPADATH